MDQIHRAKTDEPGQRPQERQRSDKPKLTERPSFPIATSAIGATIVGAVTAFVPLWRVEAFVTAVGISELIPFAAPPLGTTARIFLILLAAIFAFAALFVILAKSSKGTEDMTQTDQNAQASDKQGFAESIKSKFSGFSLPKFGPARKQRNEQSDGGKDRNVTHLSDLPKIRPFETAEEPKPVAQPEETARQPILAAKELGSPMMSVPVDNEKVADFRPADPNTPPENAPSLQEIVGRVEEQAKVAPPPPPTPVVDKPVLPPLVAREADSETPSDVKNDQRNASGINFQTTNARPNEENNAPEAAMTEAAAVPSAPPKKPADLSALNVDELMERLEKGLTGSTAEAFPPQAKEPTREPLTVQADEVTQRKTVAAEPVFAADDSAEAGQEVPAVQHPVESKSQPDPVVTPLNVADIDETREQKENMDAALKAALDTLQRMTAQGR